MSLTPGEAFYLGSISYPAMELLSRKRTHPSMALAGGLSVLTLNWLSHKHWGRLRKSITAGVTITGIELVIGILFNRRHQIWDYRRQPWNLKGQICLPFTLLWTAISYAYFRVMH